MLVKDLKNELKKYKNEEKDKIIIELYKRIPKNIKEDYDLDNFIINLNGKEKVKKEEKEINIEELAKEINYFLSCARNNLYVSPNRIIPKNERSKWRFKVMKYYKLLNSFKPDTKDGIIATELLKELFIILSYGTHYLTFSNWETFKAIKIPQSSFLETIIKRKLATGINKETLKYCINLLYVEFDPYEYHKDLLIVFESSLKTVDMKYMAIDLLKSEVIIQKDKYLTLIKERKETYYQKERINYFVECIVDIYFKLSEIDLGISYFHKNYLENDPEVKEYILLEYLEEFDLIKDWITEYEKYLGKIDYRNSLKEKYQKLKNIDFN